jgi:16S rRNA processing protein RimM
MKKEECYELGVIRSTHGLNGEVTALLDVDFPDEYLDLGTIFIEIKSQLVPYFVEDMRLKGKDVVIAFEDVETIEESQKLRGCKLFLPLADLPELPDDEFYYHQLIGYALLDAQKGEIGKVETIAEMPGQVLAQTTVSGREVLIPLTKGIVINIDDTLKVVNIELPDGLLEVYLED